jgi:hypothetical protein
MWRRTGSHCVYFGEKAKLEGLRVNDKQSIARNSIETGKIWKRVDMMNSAMTLSVAMAVTGGLVVA